MRQPVCSVCEQEWKDCECVTDQIGEDIETAGLRQEIRAVRKFAIDARSKAFEECAKRAELEAEDVKAMDDYPMKGSSRIALEIASAIRALAQQGGVTMEPRCFLRGHDWQSTKGGWGVYYRNGQRCEGQITYFHCSRCQVSPYSPMYSRQTISDWKYYLREQWRAFKWRHWPREPKDDELPF